MASSIATKLACMVVMCLMVGAPLAEAAIECGTVATKVQPCLGYLKTGGAVPRGCCDGIRYLNSVAKTTADRQSVCKCLKAASGSIAGLQPGLVNDLPSKCGVNVPYKISPTTDCSKIK